MNPMPAERQASQTSCYTFLPCSGHYRSWMAFSSWVSAELLDLVLASALISCNLWDPLPDLQVYYL